MFKTYSSSSSLVITSCWFATSRLRVPASVRRVYCCTEYQRAVGFNKTSVVNHENFVVFQKKKQFEIVVCKMTATMSHAQCVEIHWWKSQMISVIFSLQMSPILYPVTPPTTVPCSLLFHLSHSQTSLSNNNFLQNTVKSLIYDAPNPKT